MSKRVEDLLDRMTLEEQVSLLAGRNFWETNPIERLDVPRLRVSDGPAGVRGTSFDGPTSMNVPCATSLAATWNRSLQREIGELLGRENHSKGSRVHLAPTVNLHRTPVGGRNFECMSEDPYLTAETAVQYVNGVQSQGVASCIKHFVGNDTEFERMTIDSQIDERTLREVYLVPFERAVRDAGVMSVMTSYNRINGDFGADSAPMLQGVLRDDWGFDGCVISDWHGVHSTVESVLAGCDLEMPGPALWRGEKLLQAVAEGVVPAEVIRDRARNILTLMERTGALDQPPGPETAREDEADFALIRRASANGMVLLKNEESVLPLAEVASIAVLGPNAANAMVMGGGSATVKVSHRSQPLDALRRRFGDRAVIAHGEGCRINKKLPEFDMSLVSGARIDYFSDPSSLADPSAKPDRSVEATTFRIMQFRDPLGRKGAKHNYGTRVTIPFTPDVSGDWEIGLESIGSARIIVDGREVLDNTEVPSGGSFFGLGKHESSRFVALTAGRTHEVVIELQHIFHGQGLGGINIGAQSPVKGNLLDEAIDLAARADLSIVVVGTNDDWESEGWDREDITLPGDQDVLVTEVAKVSKRTIVVINAGSPVAMPWVEDVEGIVYAWFGGQEMGEALVDLLTGDVEPSGRLPVTMPRRLVDMPAAETHPGRNGKAQYLEGRLIGHRWYDKTGKEPLFPFGFGLGYADVKVTGVSVVDRHCVEATLENTSSRDGVQVVQVYAHRVEREGLPNDEPINVLVGYQRAEVKAGATATVTVNVNPDAYRTWDVERGGWTDWTGPIELRVGTSSRHLPHSVRV